MLTDAGSGARGRATSAGSIVHACGMLLFGLHVPMVSMLGLVVAAIDLPRLIWFRGIGKRFLLTWSVLALGLSAYYAVSVEHGFVEWPASVGYASVALLAYATGYCKALSSPRPESGRWAVGLLAAIGGAVAFAASSVITAPTFDIAKRVAGSIWDGSLMNAPGMGALGSLGMVLGTVAVFGTASTRRGRVLLRLFFGAVAAMGVYCNVVLQNRTAFLAFGVALASGAVVFVRAPSANTRHRVARVVAIAAVFAVGLFVLWRAIADMPLFQRFETDGLETARYELWLTVFRGLPAHPWGGRAIRITEHYAHNLWLDVGWDAGIVPFVLLLCFHALHIRPATQFVRHSASLNVRLIIVCVGIAFLFTAMAEPVLALPIAYFGVSCYYLGAVLGLRDRMICSRPRRGYLANTSPD